MGRHLLQSEIHKQQTAGISCLATRAKEEKLPTRRRPHSSWTQIEEEKRREEKRRERNGERRKKEKGRKK
eukprot:scaffold3952_cov134-Pinguiococcus_pyrenoidosus.AAC.1